MDIELDIDIQNNPSVEMYNIYYLVMNKKSNSLMLTCKLIKME
jgi:hypothetical protein